MKKAIPIVLGVFIVCICLAIWVFGLPEHPTQVVSQEYNFSAAFPDKPTVKKEINDEGLLKTTWTVKHDHGTWAEYFEISATCYAEVLDPDKEFEGADDDPTLVLNGVRAIKSERATFHAVETGRALAAFARVSSDANTGMLVLHTAILDGRCWIDAASRADRDAGPATAFIASVKMLR